MNDPDLAGVLKQFLDNGWAGLGNATAEMDGSAEPDENEQLRIAQMVEATFSTQAGKETLELLLDQTLRRTTWAGGLRLPMDQITTYGLFREGQNSIVAQLIALIAMARNETAQTREEA